MAPALFTQPFYNPATFSWHGVFRGTSIAVLTYIGFDGISTLSEEAENPKRNILIATVLVCVITGVLSSLEVYAAQLVWGSKPFPKEMVESAFPLVARQAGGFFLFHLVNFTILIANVGSGMGAQLAAARLLYGMGRSDAIPRGFFGVIEPKRRIPMNNIVLIGAIALIGAFLVELRAWRGIAEFRGIYRFHGSQRRGILPVLRARTTRRTGRILSVPMLGFGICLFIWLNLSQSGKVCWRGLDRGGNSVWCHKNERLPIRLGTFRGTQRRSLSDTPPAPNPPALVMPKPFPCDGRLFRYGAAREVLEVSPARWKGCHGHNSTCPIKVLLIDGDSGRR